MYDADINLRHVCLCRWIKLIGGYVMVIFYQEEHK